MSRYSAEVITYAASRGIDAAELPLVSNGCSGGLSWLYALGDKSVSCEDCCHVHDIDYELGGMSRDRAAADRRLRECAARAGAFPPGWRGIARRMWRGFRAWALWAVVRLCGWWYWAE